MALGRRNGHAKGRSMRDFVFDWSKPFLFAGTPTSDGTSGSGGRLMKLGQGFPWRASG